MSKFITWLKGLFTEKSYQDSIEYYVASKRPTTSSEVEYWIREYDQSHRQKGWAQ